LIFAEKAEQEDLPNIARLFRAITYAEFVRVKNHFKKLDEIKRTIDNLQAAIEGEKYEVEDMYPAFKAKTELQDEKGAIGIKSWALEAEKNTSKNATKSEAGPRKGRRNQSKNHLHLQGMRIYYQRRETTRKTSYFHCAKEYV